MQNKFVKRSIKVQQRCKEGPVTNGKKLLNLSLKYIENVEMKVNEVTLSKQTRTRRIELLSIDLSDL